eukprot:Opistho-1_new@3312
MSSQYKPKVLVVGPSQAGKTVISNFLADLSDSVVGDYKPTQGVRILEFDRELPSAGRQRSVTAQVELWDVSGDSRFEACYPAILKDAIAVVLVFDPEDKSQTAAIENWHSRFVYQTGLKDNQCIVFAHRSTQSGSGKVKLSKNMQKIPVFMTNVESTGELIKSEFTNLLANVHGIWSENREKEELSVMNN